MHNMNQNKKIKRNGKSGQGCSWERTLNRNYFEVQGFFSRTQTT